MQMQKEKAMTEEKKMTNEEIAESILGCCSCREDWAKRDMRDPECQWCENGDLIVEALDEKDKEIARLRSRVFKVLPMEDGDDQGYSWKAAFCDENMLRLHVENELAGEKEAYALLSKLLERRTGALKNIVDNIETWSFEVIESEAHQALQDDGKEKI